MSKLYDLQELVRKTGLQERTVRYYLNKVLKAPGGTRGRKAFYPRETLDQLLLAKKVLMQDYDPKRGEVKPSLMDFQNWLEALTVEEIRKLLEMPYRIKPRALLEASAPPLSNSLAREEKQQTTDTAAQYLNRVMRSTPPEPPHQQQWQSFRFGNDLEINTRARLTPEQLEQIRLAGKLLQSMLREKQP